MNIDIPRLPPKPQFEFEQQQPQYTKSFAKIAEEDIGVDDFAKQQAPDAGDWGGYIVTTSPGTAASGTSVSTVRTEAIPYFIPSEGLNIWYIQELHQISHNKLQLVTYPSEKEVKK